MRGRCARTSAWTSSRTVNPRVRRPSTFRTESPCATAGGPERSRTSLGLGANVPFETGNQSDSLHALVDDHCVELRVPYPMGSFTKGLEVRIDDPGAGWKGRALWASSGNRTPHHI